MIAILAGLLLPVVAVMGAALVLALTERRVALPRALLGAVEARLDARLAPLSVGLGGASVGLGPGYAPQLHLSDVTLDGPQGELLRLESASVAFDRDAALAGRPAPVEIALSGAGLALARDETGRFSVAFGGAGTSAPDPGALLDAVDRALARPPFDRVERLSLDGARIVLDDARAGRSWRLDGRAALARGDGANRLTLSARSEGGGALSLALESRIGDGRARLTAEIEDVAAADLAAQAPALAALRVLEAPLGGRIDARLGADGALAGLAARLDIGAGVLRPRAATAPLEFAHATAALSYDPAAARIELEAVEVEAELGAARVTGTAHLGPADARGVPSDIVAQLSLERLRLDTPGLFEAPLAAEGGVVDARLKLDPFTLEVGQVALPHPSGDPARTLHARGDVQAMPEGWRVAVDLTAARLAVADLAAYWPVPVARGVRTWFTTHVAGGALTDAAAAIRLAPGSRHPALTASAGFEGTEVTPLATLPPVADAAGTLSVTPDRFAVRVDAGTVTPEGRPAVALAGTTFTIPDTRRKPALAEIVLAAEGELPSILALVDAPPFRVLSRTGRDPDLAEGHATTVTEIALPLRPGITLPDVTLHARADVTDFASDVVVPGRTIAARALAVDVTPEAISAEGSATFDGLPFTGRWRQAFTGAREGRVTGRAEVTPARLARLGVALPEGLVSGATGADVRLDLAPDTALRLSVSSDLAGLALDIPAVGWSKTRARTGTFVLSGHLGPVPDFDRLELDAPGLSVAGRIEMGAGPRFKALALDRVRVGDWLDTSVRITARDGPPAVTVTGGSLDLRRSRLGGGGGGGGGTGAPHGPITARLDRLQVTDTLALRGLSAEIAAGRGVSGSFSGRVNGGVEVVGRLVPDAAGTAIRLQSRDAGRLLADAGLIRRVEGGALDLVLRPAGPAGTYEGRVSVAGPRLRDAPAIANLLSAISVVGLVEQLEGQGIPFETVDAEFRLSPDRVTLYGASAVGNALGLSVDGTYDLGSKRMDMQGVVSPIYLLNRVGAIFTRRGEGLFGVNFTLRGPASDPEVGVNPLSILTPGAFREIFRRPPPARVR